MTIFRFPLTALMLGCLIVQLAADGRAQEYPSKPIRYIVPSSPGSAVDTIGRIVAGQPDELAAFIKADIENPETSESTGFLLSRE